MNWSKTKEKVLHHLRNFSQTKGNYLTYNSQLRIPVLVNTIHVTQASTQTNSKTRHRRKYRHMFDKCLVELKAKYSPIPAYDSIDQCIWSKLLESREDLYRLNEILENLDQRLDYLSRNICSK